LEIDNPQPTECQRIRNEIDAAMIFTVGLRKRAPSGAKETRISIASIRRCWMRFVAHPWDVCQNPKKGQNRGKRPKTWQ
jgi:hypothetical protein